MTSEKRMDKFYIYKYRVNNAWTIFIKQYWELLYINVRGGLIKIINYHCDFKKQSPLNDEINRIVIKNGTRTFIEF